MRFSPLLGFEAGDALHSSRHRRPPKRAEPQHNEHPNTAKNTSTSLNLNKAKLTTNLSQPTVPSLAASLSPRAAKPLISMEPLHGNPDAALIAAPMLTPAARATR